jgi:hypothetical protein
MRHFLAVICVVCCTGAVLAQSQSESPTAARDAKGRPLEPDAKGKADTTTPTSTPGKGAPASSPQGETPPGNMAAPDGSSYSVKPKE